jgi:hypothetical protein
MYTYVSMAKWTGSQHFYFAIPLVCRNGLDVHEIEVDNEI